MAEKYADQVIVALDGMPKKAAKTLILKLALLGVGFKVGLEFICAGEADDLYYFIRNHGGWTFADPKIHDIPKTAERAAYRLAGKPVRIFNVHVSGSGEMMRAAVEGVSKYFIEYENPYKDKPLILGVTILTSLDLDDLEEIGFKVFKPYRLGKGKTSLEEDQKKAKILEEKQVREIVVKLAVLARDSGLDGVVCSGKEIEAIREACGENFALVVPGIRPKWAAKNDQKRIITPADAILAGAHKIVIGRPITDPPKEIGSPVKAVKLILAEIAEAMGEVEK